MTHVAKSIEIILHRRLASSPVASPSFARRAYLGNNTFDASASRVIVDDVVRRDDVTSRARHRITSSSLLVVVGARRDARRCARGRVVARVVVSRRSIADSLDRCDRDVARGASDCISKDIFHGARVRRRDDATTIDFSRWSKRDDGASSREIIARAREERERRARERDGTSRRTAKRATRSSAVDARIARRNERFGRRSSSPGTRMISWWMRIARGRWCFSEMDERLSRGARARRRTCRTGGETLRDEFIDGGAWTRGETARDGDSMDVDGDARERAIERARWVLRMREVYAFGDAPMADGDGSLEGARRRRWR